MDLIKQTSENSSKQKDSKAFEKAGRVTTNSLQTSLHNIHKDKPLTNRDHPKKGNKKNTS